MGQRRSITAHFSGNRRYFENKLGTEFDFTQSTGPYEYLLGALSGCFYSTLASFGEIIWSDLDIEVVGIKRDTVPTMLENTTMLIKAHGVSDKARFEELIARAAADCSIYNTISAVSKMEWSIEYL